MHVKSTLLLENNQETEIIVEFKPNTISLHDITRERFKPNTYYSTIPAYLATSSELQYIPVGHGLGEPDSQ